MNTSIPYIMGISKLVAPLEGFMSTSQTLINIWWKNADVFIASIIDYNLHNNKRLKLGCDDWTDDYKNVKSNFLPVYETQRFHTCLIFICQLIFPFCRSRKIQIKQNLVTVSFYMYSLYRAVTREIIGECIFMYLCFARQISLEKDDTKRYYQSFSKKIRRKKTQICEYTLPNYCSNYGPEFVLWRCYFLSFFRFNFSPQYIIYCLVLLIHWLYHTIVSRHNQFITTHDVILDNWISWFLLKPYTLTYLIFNVVLNMFSFW